MIKKTISRSTFQEHLITLIRDELAIEAIKDDGIYSTFKFDNKYFPTGIIKTTLQYYRFNGDGCSWIPMQKKIFYKTCPELGDVRLPYVGAGSLEKVADRIKLDVAKYDNGIWSTIQVEPYTDYFTVSYEKAYVDDKPDYVKYAESDAKATNEALTNLCNKVYAEAGIKATEGPMTAQEMEIENTKRALRRLEWLNRNSYYGLYPRHAGLTTYAFDEMSKQSLKKTLEIWKAKADLDIHSPSKELLFNYYNKQHKKEEKEKKDMNITLMVVPEGMSKDFVRKVKANYQSNNSLRLFIASTDIDYSCEHEPIKTKYDLFEKWIKTGYVDVVYFMLGFEKDPDVRAFESFVRGITENGAPGKVDIHVVYQKDDICNDASRLRSVYFDEADAKEDLEKAGNKVVKEAKTMQDIYGLDDEGLEAIRNSTGRIDASEEFVMGKIMDMAFAEEAAETKKGGKK